MKRLPKQLPNSRMTVAEVAGLLNITSQSVRNHIHIGNLIAHKESHSNGKKEGDYWIITGVNQKQKRYVSQGHMKNLKAEKPLPGYYAPGRFVGDPNCSHMVDPKPAPKKVVFNTKNKQYE